MRFNARAVDSARIDALRALTRSVFPEEDLVSLVENLVQHPDVCNLTIRSYPYKSRRFGRGQMALSQGARTPEDCLSFKALQPCEKAIGPDPYRAPLLAKWRDL